MTATERCFGCGQTFSQNQVFVVIDSNRVAAFFCAPCKAAWDAAVAAGKKAQGGH